jgi:putative RecB family exonuclease
LAELYSHSRLKCFENCRKQFHFRYVLKLPQESEGVEAFVGKRVHEVLERLYHFVGQDMLPALPQVLRRYEQAWEAEYDPDRVRIVKQGTPLSFYRELGARCLETYYRRHYPFDGDETLAIEERVEFSLDDEGAYAMQGIIDRISRTPDGTTQIIDYKTGGYVPNQKALDEDRQLALYQIGLADRYGPERPVELVWYYLARGAVRRSRRTPEQLQGLREHTIARIDEVRAESEYAPRKNTLCDWCEYRSVCPAWNPHAVHAKPTQRSPEPVSSEPPKPPEPAEPAEPAAAAIPRQLSLL